MQLNKKQTKFLWGGIAALAVTGLCPPWEITRSAPIHTSGAVPTAPIGYHLIFFPPPADVDSWCGANIDLDRLLIEWVLIAAVTAGLIFTKGQESPPKD